MLFLTGFSILNDTMSAKSFSLTQPVTAAQNGGENVYDDGYLRVEHDNYYVFVGGQILKFPRAEFLLLSRLARNPERIVSAEDLWQNIWGDNKPLNVESLHVYIYRLRSKLEPYGLKIEAMIGVGYRLMLAEARKDDRTRQ